MKTRILLVIAVVMFLAHSAIAAEYYMSPFGNDSNPGTLAAPWKTMNKLVEMQSSLNSGDIVYFRDGDYVFTDANSRTYFPLTANGVTYKNYQSEKPYLVQDKRIPNQSRNPGGPLWIFATMIYLSGNNITFDGINIRQSPESRAVAQHDRILEGLRYGNAQGATVSGDHVTVRNCSITNFSASSIGVSGSNFLMENCYLATSGHGAYITGSNGTYRFNVFDGINGYYNQFGIQIQKINGHTPRGNLLYGNLMMNGQSAGIVLSSAVEGNQIFNNVIVNGGNKLRAEPGHALVPGHAVAFVCYHGEIPGAGNKIYNNTFIGKSPGGLLQTGQCPASNGQNIGYRVEIFNNIFYPSSPVSVGMRTSNVHGNIFYNISGAVPSGNTLVNPNLVNPNGITSTDAMLQAGSPAIDQATSGAPSFDYRSGARPVGAAADVGAFEYGAPPGAQGGPLAGSGSPGDPSFPCI